MKLVRLLTLSLVVVAGLLPSGAAAQSFPVVRGTWTFQLGASGMVLPERYDALWSLQLEGRAAMFLVEGLELQAQGDVRVWPLGAKAPKAYGFTGNVLWYPRIGDTRNLYLLGGGGGYLRQGETPAHGEDGFQPLLRGGLGTHISLEQMGPVRAFHFTTEFRVDVLFEEETSFSTGIALGLSYFI
jgi:hypothetical protein